MCGQAETTRAIADTNKEIKRPHYGAIFSPETRRLLIYREKASRSNLVTAIIIH